MKTIELTGITASDGSLTITGTKSVTGFIERIDYDYSNAATGAVLTVTTSGQAVSAPVMIKTGAGTADVSYFPRSLANKSTDASAFTNVAEKIYLANESLKLVVASAGDTKGIRLLIYVSNE